MALEINTSDPAVQRMLGQDGHIHAPGGRRERELVHIAGDMDRGISSTVDLTTGAIGHPKVTYRDFVLELDVYAMPGEPMKVHLICPRCQHHCTVSGDRKRIEYDRSAGDPALGGRIDIETFQCTWELDDKVTVGSALFNTCRWQVAIDKNVARDA